MPLEVAMKTFARIVAGIVSILAAASFVTAAPPAGAARSGLGQPRGWGGWTPRPATYGVATTRDVPIRMSDGVTLFVNLYRPAKADGSPVPGRFPVVLTQTPYNKNSPTLNFESDYLVQRGYVQVIADVRGTGASEGAWDSFGAREQRDGAELVRWAETRPWSNGRIALHGTSYGAINQLFTMAQQPGGIRAAFPIVPMSDAYRDITASGGQVNTSFIPSWLGLVTGLGLLPPTYSATDPAETLTVLNQHAQNIPNFQAHAVLDAMEGGKNAYDSAFFHQRSPIDVIDRVRVPTFVVGGWFDLFQRGEPLLYRRLRHNGVPTHLLMGPWYHITAGDGLPADGVPALNELELRWFDHYVRGVPDPGLSKTPPVTYFQNGEGHWHFAPSWPPPVRYRQLYLSGPSAPGSPGTLQASAPARQAADVLPWQPISGACTRSTVQWTAGAGAGSLCESDNELNDQTGLTYDVSLAQGLQVAGPIAVRLFVGTNGHDSLLTVRVEDVDANGRATQLTAGWNVISLRALDPARSLRAPSGVIIRPYHPFTRASARPVKDGRVYRVWVEVFPTAALFAPGHSLRLSLQPSDAPHLAPPLPQLDNEVGGILSLYHDARHPSAVVIPVRP
jgi:uncharacterized protein